MKPSPVRVALGQLWEQLPAQHRQRALVVLGRMIVASLATAVPPSLVDARRRAGLPGKEAGDENA